jgi:hypothetical protein
MTNEEKKAPMYKLPQRAKGEDIEHLIELLKEKAGKRPEGELGPLIGTGNYSYVKAAAEILGFVTAADDYLNWSDAIGRRFAYSKLGERKEIWFGVLMKHQPYEFSLSKLLRDREANEIETSDIINFWGKELKIELSKDAFGRAIASFGSFLEKAELGKYVRGRKGVKSRIVLEDDARSRVEAFKAVPVEEIAPPPESQAIAKKEPIVEPPIAETRITPTVNINIDISGWDMDKIKLFFQYLYGQFEE